MHYEKLKYEKNYCRYSIDGLKKDKKLTLPIKCLDFSRVIKIYNPLL